MLWFKPERPIDQVAGQFIELSLPHDDADDRGTKRWFTISSSPTEPLLTITTRFVGDCSSFKRHLQSLKPGDELTVSDPMGDFVLPMNQTIPLVFVALGIGITPVRSMVRWLNDKQQQRHIDLLYASRSPEELLFLGIFRQQRLRLHQFVDRQHEISADYIIDEIKPTADSLLYLSGPEIVVESLQQDLQNRGISGQQIVIDAFPGYLHS